MASLQLFFFVLYLCFFVDLALEETNCLSLIRCFFNGDSRNLGKCSSNVGKCPSVLGNVRILLRNAKSLSENA